MSLPEKYQHDGKDPRGLLGNDPDHWHVIRPAGERKGGYAHTTDESPCEALPMGGWAADMAGVPPPLGGYASSLARAIRDRLADQPP